MKKNAWTGLVLMTLIGLSLLTGCAKPPFGNQDNLSGGDDQLGGSNRDLEEVALVKDPAIIGYDVADNQHDDPVKGVDIVRQQTELPMVHFEFDQFTLTQETRLILVSNALYLKENQNVIVVLEGYCDDLGSDEYNVVLSELRGIAVRNYLVKLGVTPKRLHVVPYGEENPLVDGAGEAARAKNRRVEFNLTSRTNEQKGYQEGL